jgi:hypothetical protein
MSEIGKSKPAESTSVLFLIPVQIGRGSSSSMPPSVLGAYVPVFAAAANQEAAAKAAASKLTAQGYEFLGVKGQIRKLDPHKWSEFVDASFPAYKSKLPNQDTVIAGLAEGIVFFGPFAGYDKQGA